MTRTTLGYNMDGKNPLNACIIENDWQKAQEKLRTDPDLAKKWSMSQSFSGDQLHATEILPLHQACAKTDVRITFLESLILAYPEALNQCEKTNNRTPLHIATKFHLPDDVISYILSKAPDAALVQDSFGRVALHYACSNLASAITIKELITTHPITVLATDHKEWTPVHVASNHTPFLAVIEIMLAFHPEAVVMVTKKGNTPVTCAEMNSSNNQELIKSFLLSEEQKLYQLPLFENMRNAEKKDKQSSSLLCSRQNKFAKASFNDKNYQVYTRREGHFV